MVCNSHDRHDWQKTLRYISSYSIAVKLLLRGHVVGARNSRIASFKLKEIDVGDML
jgi:hypothetical protein